MIKAIKENPTVQSMRQRTREFWARNGIELISGSALLVLLAIVLYPYTVYSIDSGQVGVEWKRFGGGTQTDPEDVRREGIQIVAPWNRLHIYDTRMERVDATVKGLSRDGLDITMNVYARFSIDANFAANLHKAIGPQYKKTLINPSLRALALKLIAENEVENLYSNTRSDVGLDIQAQFEQILTSVVTNLEFDKSFILVEDVLIDEIVLPEIVRTAIQNKMSVRHLSDSYEFRLELEEQERTRKGIEADGIRNFQEVVGQGITDSYLRWRGIEATVKLAESENSKIVVIGGGGDGLPIILNADSAPTGGNTGDGPPALPPFVAPQDGAALAPEARQPSAPVTLPAISNEILNRLEDTVRNLPEGANGAAPPLPPTQPRQP